MLAIVVPRPDEKLLGALQFQKNKDFKVYVPLTDLLAHEYEGQLNIVSGSLKHVEEPLCWILEPGALPDKQFVRRVLRSIGRHPEFDVYHVNLREGWQFPRKMKVARFFRRTLIQAVPAPLSSFVFRTECLKEKAVFLPDNRLNPLATVMACAQEKPIRTVWLQKLDWTAPARPQDLEEEEQRIQDRLDLLRWTETFFGEDDYPLGTGDRLDLYAAQVARLHPAHTPDELKELMLSFQVSQGPLRKMRAMQALKSAVKERQKVL